MVRAGISGATPYRRRPPDARRWRRQAAGLQDFASLRVLRASTAYLDTQIVVLSAMMLSPGAESDPKRSLTPTCCPSLTEFARFCCHTAYSVLPGLHSHRSTTLLRKDRLLKSRLARLKVDA